MAVLTNIAFWVFDTSRCKFLSSLLVSIDCDVLTTAHHDLNALFQNLLNNRQGRLLTVLRPPLCIALP